MQQGQPHDELPVWHR